MSLRVRLALLYALLAAPTLAVFAVAVFLVARNRVYDSVDQTLVNRANVVTSSLAHVDPSLSTSDIAASAAALDRLAVSGDAFQLFDASGRRVYSSDGTGAGAAPEVRLASSSFRTLDEAGQRTRSYTAPIVRLGTSAGSVQVTTSLAQADSTLADLRWILVLGGVGIALLIAVPAYLLAGHALAPVSRASNLAREIEETGDFTRRMPAVSGSGDLAELTRTLNSLIGRVDEMMKAQRAFLADSSHELRRPLTIIRTNIDVMNDPRLTHEERETIEAEMREEAQSMSKLITDLHLLAREQLVEMRCEPFDLSKVCEAAVESTLRRYGHLHEFDAQIPPAIDAVGDDEQMERVLINLLENAAVYTPTPGRIRFLLESRENALRIVVSDTGIGMSEEDSQHVFERFYRAKGSQQIKPDGFGLGLAIVKHIVDSHQGTIRVRSVLGKGTSFCIDLPKAPIPSVLKVS